MTCGPTGSPSSGEHPLKKSTISKFVPTQFFLNSNERSSDWGRCLGFSLQTKAGYIIIHLGRKGPTNGRRKKTDVWCFRRFFFWLIRATKTPQTRHFVRFCGIFCGSADFCHLRHLLCQNFAAKTPQIAVLQNAANLTKCHVCTVFAARISGKKWKNHKIRILLRWGSTSDVHLCFAVACYQIWLILFESKFQKIKACSSFF